MGAWLPDTSEREGEGGLLTGTAVEWSLWGRVSALGPAEDPSVGAEHGVLLLESVEGLLARDLLVEDVREPVPGVGGVGNSI